MARAIRTKFWAHTSDGKLPSKAIEKLIAREDEKMAKRSRKRK